MDTSTCGGPRRRPWTRVAVTCCCQRRCAPDSKPDQGLHQRGVLQTALNRHVTLGTSHCSWVHHALPCPQRAPVDDDSADHHPRRALPDRVDYNTVRPQEALSWNGPVEIHTGGWPTRASPTFPSPRSCQLLDAGHSSWTADQTGKSSLALDLNFKLQRSRFANTAVLVAHASPLSRDPSSRRPHRSVIACRYPGPLATGHTGRRAIHHRRRRE
jgi:hypothetical protein